MPSKEGRTGEREIGLAVLKYLNTVPGGEATIAEIKKHIAKHFPLTAADQEDSETRRNEQVWEQQVRNLVSHRETDDNVINDGLLSYRPRRLAITDAGRSYVKRRFG